MDEYISETPLAPPAGVPKARRRPLPRWVLFLVSALVVLSIGLVGVLGVSLVQANRDNEVLRDDLQANVDANATEIARLESQLDAGTEHEAGLEARLTTAESELADANGELTDAKLELNEFEGVREGVIEFFAMSMALGAGMGEDDATCVAESMADEMGVAQLLAGTLASADAAFGAEVMNSEIMEFGLVFVKASEDCDVSLAGEALGQGFAYGDSPALDALYDQCAAGALASCDALYTQSALGSEYERFGQTCGDRYSLSEAPLYCAP